ncbi:hypothetical protein L1887_57061 [Cichorium endivia]|nr:hypothetical protein L1887_57061 [Cichorium endivia]
MEAAASSTSPGLRRGMSATAVTACSLELPAAGRPGDAERDLLAVDLDGSTGLLGLGETRVDPAESNGVDADAEGTPLLAHGLGQAEDTSLGGRVVDLADVAVGARGGGDVDDGHVLALALVLDAEVGCGGADDAEGGGDVAVEHELEGGVVGGVGHLVGGEAGVVDNDVELAPLVDGGLDDALAKVLVHDVAGVGDGRATGLDDLGGNIGCLLSVQVRDDDVGAVASEELGGGRSDTLASTGDDGDLALEQRGGCEGIRRVGQRVGSVPGHSFRDAGVEAGRAESDPSPRRGLGLEAEAGPSNGHDTRSRANKLRSFSAVRNLDLKPNMGTPAKMSKVGFARLSPVAKLPFASVLRRDNNGAHQRLNPERCKRGAKWDACKGQQPCSTTRARSSSLAL